eukprot:gene4602-4812_t
MILMDLCSCIKGTPALAVGRVTCTDVPPRLPVAAEGHRSLATACPPLTQMNLYKCVFSDCVADNYAKLLASNGPQDCKDWAGALHDICEVAYAQLFGGQYTPTALPVPCDAAGL